MRFPMNKRYFAKLAAAAAVTSAGVAVLVDPSIAHAAKGIADYQDTVGGTMKAVLNIGGWAATLGGFIFIVSSVSSLYRKSKQAAAGGQQPQGVGGDIAGLILACVLIVVPLLAGIGPASLFGNDAKTVKIGDKNFADTIGN